MSKKIEVIVWPSKNQGSDGVYYVKNVVDQWLENLKQNFPQHQINNKGDLIIHINPTSLMDNMGIKYDFIDKRNNAHNAQTTSQNQNNQAVVPERVWSENGLVLMDCVSFKTNANAKNSFKAVFAGAKFQNGRWEIPNTNEQAVMQYFGMNGAVNQNPQKNNATMVNSSSMNVVDATSQEINKAIEILQCIQAGGNVRVVA